MWCLHDQLKEKRKIQLIVVRVFIINKKDVFDNVSLLIRLLSQIIKTKQNNNFNFFLIFK